jgi:hypothetical protein
MIAMPLLTTFLTVGIVYQGFVKSSAPAVLDSVSAKLGLKPFISVVSGRRAEPLCLQSHVEKEVLRTDN